VLQQTPSLSKGALRSQLLVDEAFGQCLTDPRCLLDTGAGRESVEPASQAQNALAARPREAPSIELGCQTTDVFRQGAAA
jgi:hypothetical protein